MTKGGRKYVGEVRWEKKGESEKNGNKRRNTRKTTRGKTKEQNNTVKYAGEGRE